MLLILITAALLTAGSFFLGKLCAKIKTEKELKNIRSQSIEKAEYSLLYTLEPIEFALLCSGAIDKNALAGQVVRLATEKVIELRFGNSGFLEATRSTQVQPHEDMRSTVSLFSKLSQPLALDTFTLQPDKITLEIEQRLTKKGWLSPEDARRNEFNSERYDRALLAATITSLVVGFASIAGLISLSGTDQEIATTIAALCALSLLIILALVIFVRSFKIAYNKHSRILRSITPAFRERFSKIYGLYLYMKVSGLDTMTPAPDDLTFSGLDKLFPYAVAAGLDPSTTARVINAKLDRSPTIR